MPTESVPRLEPVPGSATEIDLILRALPVEKLDEIRKLAAPIFKAKKRREQLKRIRAAWQSRNINAQAKRERTRRKRKDRVPVAAPLQGKVKGARRVRASTPEQRSVLPLPVTVQRALEPVRDRRGAVRATVPPRWQSAGIVTDLAVVLAYHDYQLPDQPFCQKEAMPLVGTFVAAEFAGRDPREALLADRDPKELRLGGDLLAQTDVRACWARVRSWLSQPVPRTEDSLQADGKRLGPTGDSETSQGRGLPASRLKALATHEWAMGAIPGAEHMPMWELHQAILDRLETEIGRATWPEVERLEDLRRTLPKSSATFARYLREAGIKLYSRKGDRLRRVSHFKRQSQL